MTCHLIQAAAVLVSTSGVVLAGWAWLLTRSSRPALPVLLDFLLAAGLLRLAVDQGWAAIAAAAAVVVIRRLTAGAVYRAATVGHRQRRPV
jgi:hypothetical protein